MEIISENRQIRNRVRQTAGLNGNNGGQAQSCTPSICGSEFLKESFTSANSQVSVGINGYVEKVQSEFFTSMFNLCKLYKLDIPSFQELGYPLNMISAFEWASKIFVDNKSRIKLAIIQDDEHLATVTTFKSFEVGNTLYYIPVQPLDCLIRDKNKQASANLILSIFSYLYKVNGVSYYTDESSYLYNVYDRLQNYIEEDWDYEKENCPSEEKDDQNEEWFDHVIEHFNSIYRRGRELLNIINQKVHLSEFKRRLKTYKAKTKAEKALKETAKLALNLYDLFPNRSVMDRIDPELFPEEDDYDYRKVNVHNYLSFFWSYNDCIFDELWEWINGELQEACLMDEPYGHQFFNTPQDAERLDLEFETKFFGLLDSLADTLNLFCYE